MIESITQRIAQRVSLTVHFILMVLIISLSTAFWVFAGKGLLNNSYAEYFYDSITMILSASSFFSFVLRCRAKFDQSRIDFSKIALLSVGVYPVHISVRNLVRKLPFPFSPSVNSILAFMLTTVISFGLMYLVSKTKLRDYLLKMQLPTWRGKRESESRLEG